MLTVLRQLRVTELQLTVLEPTVLRQNRMDGVNTWGDVEASSPFCDLGVLVLPQLLVVVQHHGGALVRHAELVGVHRHAGHPLHAEVKGGDGVAQLAGKGQHKPA